MRHFIAIQDLTKFELEKLLDHTDFIATSHDDAQIAGITAASLFFENSTRTRVSFELAAKRLGAHFVNVDLERSSQKKGETIWDTVATLQAMGVNQFIIRTSETGLPRLLGQRVDDQVSIINAGEAHLSHPSQALLDLVTLRQCKGAIDQLRIAIVGDIAHSRVARSFVKGACLLGCTDIRLIAPSEWQTDPSEFEGAQFESDLKTGLDGVDAIMALRIQHERMSDETRLSLNDYCKRYAIDKRTVEWATKNAIVMHPGPFNRNVEITDEVADGPRSVILKQVQMGVPARMAIMSMLARETA